MEKIVQYTADMGAYLKCGGVIDYDNETVAALSESLFRAAKDETDFVKRAYEYVRDTLPHSADIGAEGVPCAASEVLRAGHGVCFAKSHLLAALLRAGSVPTGFCYQKLILDDETAPLLIYHGLNAVFLQSLQKWIRLDARGNKPGVNAQFSTGTEQLAFPVRPEKGEEDGFVVYPDPDAAILETLQKSPTRAVLWEHLPTALAYTEK